MAIISTLLLTLMGPLVFNHYTPREDPFEICLICHFYATFRLLKKHYKDFLFERKYAIILFHTSTYALLTYLFLPYDVLVYNTLVQAYDILLIYNKDYLIWIPFHVLSTILL